MKRTSIILLVLWSIAVVLILTFGVKPYQKIVNYFSHYIYQEANKLEDVTLKRTSFSKNLVYYLEYETSPDNYHDMGIVLTNLTPDIYSLDDKRIQAINNKTLEEEGETIGLLEITSTIFPEFKKIVELHFQKVYATRFSLKVTNGAYLNKDIYLGVPIVINYDYGADLEVSEVSDIEIIYDSQYFDLISSSNKALRLNPKVNTYQKGDNFEPVNTTITFKYYGNIVKTLDLRINPVGVSEKYERFDICLNSTSVDKLIVDNSYNIQIYDDILLYTDFTITSSNSDVLVIDELNHLKPLKKGTSTIRVSLNNGYYQEREVQVINNLKLPTIYYLTLEDDAIIVYDDEDLILNLYFANKASMDSFQLSPLNNFQITQYVDEDNYLISLVIKMKQEATEVLEIKVADEDQSHTVKYNLKSIINKVSQESIYKRVARFIGKIAGHASFFVMEAILAFFMLFYLKLKKKWLNVIIFVLIGLFIASLTEFIQLFIPGRYGAIKDIGIDMLGYSVGFIISLILSFFLKYLIRYKKYVIK